MDIRDTGPQIGRPFPADDPHFDMVLIGEGGYAGAAFIAQAT